MTMPHANLEDAHVELGDMSDVASESPELFYLDPSWLLVDRGALGAVIRSSASGGP